MERYTYHITIEGRLDATWADWFGDVELQSSEHVTSLIATLPDQAALFGILKKLHHLGLVLITVTRLPIQAPDERKDDETACDCG